MTDTRLHTGDSRDTEPTDGWHELVLDRVSKVFPGRGHLGRVVAIEEATGTIDAGAFVTIVGPSGCGKSTLLEMAAGLMRPTSGQVIHRGRVIDGPVDDIAVVFQEESTLPWRTVRQNVELPLELKGLSRGERRERAEEAIRLVGLASFANARPRELSGGMRQRVAIARALVGNPQLLLMDEPFGALDQQTRVLIGEELRRLWQETSRTILFVTHDINEAVYLGTEVWVMGRRPSVIRSKMAVPWAYQPDLAGVLKLPEFAELTAGIWELLRDEARSAMVEDSDDGSG